MLKLAPSILSADFAQLGEEVKRISDAGCDFVHIDIMDGHFVPNLTLGPQIVKSIRPYSNKVFDVHLMLSEPMKYADSFIDAGADYITIHVEAVNDLQSAINQIKSRGVKAGLTMKPDTDCSIVEPYIKELDMVLVMSVNPGFGGQSFMDSAFDKIRQVREMADRLNPDLLIEVDGGIHLGNIEQVIAAGANVFVAGSAVFNCEDINERINAFKQIFALYDKDNSL